MMWKYVRAILYSIFWLIVAGVANLLGLAPEMVIAHILGPEDTARIINSMIEFNADILRWAFVIVGNAAVAMALLWLVQIPLWRLERRIKASDDKYEWASNEVKAVRAELAAARKDSRRRELTARRLHAMTRKALQKWRAQILDDIK